MDMLRNWLNLIYVVMCKCVNQLRHQDFQCKCSLMGLHNAPGPVWFYPQSELMACHNHLWKTKHGHLDADVVAGLTGMRLPKDVQFVMFDFARARLRMIEIVVVTNSYTFSARAPMVPASTICVARIQRWFRRVLWRRKAVAVLAGVRMNADVMRMILLMSR